LGKDLTPQGIITAEQLPAAIAILQEVRRHFQCNVIASQNTDTVLSHFPARVGNQLMTVI